MIKVLIADDEEKVCQLIKNLIDCDELGLEIVGLANNGVEAVNLIEQKKPDIVITDIRMPGYDGIEMIRRAKEIDPSIGFIIVSGYRHFEYAHQAIKYGVEDYLLKPLKKSELMKTLGKMVEKHRQREDRFDWEEKIQRRIKSDMEKLRETFMVDLLFESESDAPPLWVPDVNERYHFQFREGFFQAVVIKTDIHDPEASAGADRLLKDKTADIAQKYLRPCCHDMLIYNSAMGTICILNYSEESSVRKPCRNILDEIGGLSDLFKGLRVTVAMGSATTDINGLGGSIRSAADAATHRIIVGTGKIIDGSSIIEPDITAHEYLTNGKRRQLERYVELLDKDSVVAWLKDIYSALIHMEHVTGKFTLSLCDEIIEQFLVAAKGNNLLRTDRNKGGLLNREFQSFHKKVLLCPSLADVFSLLIGEVTDFLDNAISEKRLSDTRPIRVAKQYMKEHYGENVTLEEISAIAGFNPSYFSSLFKKETGVNYLEYLTELRIAAAKEILMETGLSVADVGLKVGYADLKYFSKQFKKVTGLNPSDFRKIYKGY